jgi:hypothetical protein
VCDQASSPAAPTLPVRYSRRWARNPTPICWPMGLFGGSRRCHTNAFTGLGNQERLISWFEASLDSLRVVDDFASLAPPRPQTRGDAWDLTLRCTVVAAPCGLMRVLGPLNPPSLEREQQLRAPRPAFPPAESLLSPNRVGIALEPCTRAQLPAAASRADALAPTPAWQPHRPLASVPHKTSRGKVRHHAHTPRPETPCNWFVLPRAVSSPAGHGMAQHKTHTVVTTQW